MPILVGHWVLVNHFFSFKSILFGFGSFPSVNVITCEPAVLVVLPVFSFSLMLPWYNVHEKEVL